MQPITEMLKLLERHAELENGLRQPGGLHVAEKQDVHALRERLQRYPQTVTAILQAAQTLRRPVDTLQPQDVHRLLV